MDQSFRFLDEGEFASLPLGEKHTYLAAALKEVIRLNEMIKRQIHDVGSPLEGC